MTEETPDPPAAPPAAADAAAGEGLAGLRERITAVDAAILDLLARRRALAREVGRTKAGNGRSVRDQSREQDLLVGLIELGRTAGLDAHYVTRVFHTIIDDSVRLQQAMLVEHSNPEQAPTIRVAFQGDRGSYSHVAIRQHFASRLDDLVYAGFDAFADAVAAVERGAADYAMLPIENTTSGGINEVYDLLMHTPLSVIGEETVAIDHCLLAHPGVAIEALERVYAHPQGFAQCSRFVSRLRHCRLESLETAEAVRRAAGDPERRSAAIASAQAGELYGLAVLERGIANQRENVTRFLCVGRRPRRVPLQIACKTSLVMATSDAPGALVEALTIFRDAGINLTKLESRPIIGNPWEEMFYIDVEANLDSPAMKAAMEQLTGVTRYLKVLGCYPTTNIPVTEVGPQHWLAPRTPASTPRGPDASGASAAPAAPAGTAARNGADDAALVVRMRGVRIGAEPFTCVTGPPAALSRNQMREDARTAAALGARVFAAGLHQGSELDMTPEDWSQMLDWLHDAAAGADLAAMATVSTPEQVAAAVQRVDGLRIPARHMENVALLQAAGRTTRPVLLTRGAMSSIDELLRAATIITAEGNRQVMLCEAGIATFEPATRSTLDLSAVAILRERCGLPVLVEPLPALSRASLVLPLVAAARAAGAAGCLLCSALRGEAAAGASAAPGDAGEGPGETTPGVVSREVLEATVAAVLRPGGTP